jgi:FRG domain
MGKLRNKAGGKDPGIDIENAFQAKKSDDFYKYHYHNEKTKQLTSSWKELRNFYYDAFPEEEASKWLFRGDIAVCDQKRSMKEAFKTSLDKAFDDCYEESEIKLEDAAKIEKAIIRSFRRRAHLFTNDKDGTRTHLETLALLRHHFGPARILDWMYSFFPAVYFAVNRYHNNETYTVWALNRKWLSHMSKHAEVDFLRDKKYLGIHFGGRRKQIRYLRKFENSRFQSYMVTYLIDRNLKSLVYAATPYHLNERIALQRGTLLFSGTLGRSWGENLQDTIVESLRTWPHKDQGNTIEGPILWEISLKLSKSRRNEFLRGLDEMNINQATLFPDLDAFAQSLRTRIAHPESLGIDVE